MNKMLLALCLCLPAVNAYSNQSNCDRSCVLELVDQYVTALVTHRPDLSEFTPQVKTTENGKDLKIGDGIWQSITGQGSYRQTFVDDSLQDAVFFGVFEEQEEPLLLAIRFHLDGEKIAEVENLVSRYDERNRLISRHQLTVANPLYDAVQPVENRLSKSALVAAANAYFDGLANNSDEGVPMHRECNRRENGVLLLNNKNPQAEPCPTNFQRFNYITDIRDRRVALVDTARGLVLVWAFFDVPGTVEVEARSYSPLDNATSPAAPEVDTRKIPRSLYIAELFRLEDGLIRDIEAIMFNLDFGSKSGWE